MNTDTGTTTPAPTRPRRRTRAEVLAAVPVYALRPDLPLHVLGSDGRLCVSVKLHGKHRKGKRMIVDEVDWARVCRTYGDRWTIKPARGQWGYVAGMAKHQQVYLARVIAKAEPGQAVVLRDGDCLNLCRGNLEVMGKREAVLRAFAREQPQSCAEKLGGRNEARGSFERCSGRDRCGKAGAGRASR